MSVERMKEDEEVIRNRRLKVGVERMKEDEEVIRNRKLKVV